MDTIKRRTLLQAGVIVSAGILAPWISADGKSSHGKATGQLTDAEVSKVPITLIGLPYLMGTRAANSMFGMAQGPIVLLQPENLPRALKSYFSDVEILMLDNVDEPARQDLARGDQMARILGQNLVLAQAVKRTRARNRLPIACIGTCSASIGMVGGLADVPEDVGMIWFDAHADAETPDITRDVFIEGMVVPIIAGKTYPRYSRQIPGFTAIPPERIIQVSLGSLPYPIPPEPDDPPMGTPVHKAEIDRVGVKSALSPALDALSQRCRKVYVHLDVDTIDPSLVKNFRVPWKLTGMTDVQVSEAFDLISQRFEILALDASSFDPTVDAHAPQVLVPLMLNGTKDAARSYLRARG